VTSGTYISHLQRVFSSPLELQYSTFSPCCHLPWSIYIPLNQSESYAALHTVSFVHGCFAGKCILTGSTE
jgi:hypothetical protein